MSCDKAPCGEYHIGVSQEGVQMPDGGEWGDEDDEIGFCNGEAVEVFRVVGVEEDCAVAEFVSVSFYPFHRISYLHSDYSVSQGGQIFR